MIFVEIFTKIKNVSILVLRFDGKSLNKSENLEYIHILLNVFIKCPKHF